MSTVVPFRGRAEAIEPPPEPETLTITGTVHCLACKHDWTGVVPVGTTGIECPSCGCFRGVWKYDFLPSSRLVFVCGCSNDIFQLTPHNAMCLNCGNMPAEFYRP